MRGFYVIDSNGRLKVVQTQALSLDPLTVPHGGTGLSSLAQGDLLYATDSTTLARLAKGSAGQILGNGGTNNNPAWQTAAVGSPVAAGGNTNIYFGGGIPGYPRPSFRVPRYFAVNQPSSAITGVAMSPSSTGAGSVVSDSNGVALQFTTAASSGTIASLAATGGLFKAEHQPFFEFKFSTDASVSNIRIWVGVFQAVPTASDTLTTRGFGARFSTNASDTKFTPWAADGTTATFGSGIGTTVATTTTFTISGLIDASRNVVIVVNGTAATIGPIGSGITGQYLIPCISVCSLTNATRTVNINTMYVESI